MALTAFTCTSRFVFLGSPVISFERRLLLLLMASYRWAEKKPCFQSIYNENLQMENAVHYANYLYFTIYKIILSEIQ